MTEKKRYRIETYDYGTFYRYARTPQAARHLVVRAIFGRRYTGYAHEFWTVTEE